MGVISLEASFSGFFLASSGHSDGDCMSERAAHKVDMVDNHLLFFIYHYIILLHPSSFINRSSYITNHLSYILYVLPCILCSLPFHGSNVKVLAIFDQEVMSDEVQRSNEASCRFQGPYDFHQTQIMISILRSVISPCFTKHLVVDFIFA